MAEQQKDGAPVYCLGDGVILSVGNFDTSVINLEKDYEFNIDLRYIEAFEKVTLGDPLLGYEPFIPRLLKDGVLQESAPAADPFIQEKLERLDSVYMGPYAQELSDTAQRAYRTVLEAHSRRKRFFERVGQCPILPETALRRALLVGEAAEVGVKKVLCLGDDDLVSIALAVLGHQVTVFDIDDFLLNFLRHTCDIFGLEVTIVEHDLRDPIDTTDAESFDVFMTDPMSNRDCFEIFLSRAFSLLKPGGVGYSAVYAPVGRLFESVSEDMKFEITGWFTRFNRYYSKYMHLHDYASDWVQLQKTEATTVKHAPEQFSVPLNLYREDYYQRPKSSVTLYADIEDKRFAVPLYLLTLLDAFERVTGLELPERTMHPAQDWTLIHCPTAKGHLSLMVDRHRDLLMVDMHPFDTKLEEALRTLLINAYKSQLSESSVRLSRGSIDVRIV